MSIQPSRFSKKNDPFQCAHCGFMVPPAEKTCRDHCPKCLYSVHVDEFPGDRAATCGGLLKPTSYELNNKKGIQIVYHCEKCGMTKKNVFLRTDKCEADNYDVLLSLSEGSGSGN